MLSSHLGLILLFPKAFFTLTKVVQIAAQTISPCNQCFKLLLEGLRSFIDGAVFLLKLGDGSRLLAAKRTFLLELIDLELLVANRLLDSLKILCLVGQLLLVKLQIDLVLVDGTLNILPVLKKGRLRDIIC